MILTPGLSVGAWVTLDADCPISFVAYEDMAELLFGGLSGPFSLAASADALEALVTAASEALRTLRDTPIEPHTDTANPVC
jgi:hypothetical protein